MSTIHHASRLLAYLSEPGTIQECSGAILYRPEGRLLQVQGDQFAQLMDHTDCVNDHDFPIAERGGLRIFEGWVENPELRRSIIWGAWRDLTHWEMCRVRQGLPPWEVPKVSEPTEESR